jgi:hypothetical protein
MSGQRALILPLLICAFLTANAQSPNATTLQLGTPVERALGPQQVQEFTVNLEENTLIQFVVQQRGIDVIVRVATPAGKSIGEYDSPNGDDGPEHVSFVAESAGSYRIAVSALDPNTARAGRFEIKVLELRQATDQEIKASKSVETVKTKGVALLAELDGLIGEIKSPLTRIRAEMQVAQLMWSFDQKRATKYFTDATNDFKEFLTSIDVSSEKFPQQHSAMFQLRAELIQALAERDPDAALSFLYSSVPPSNPYSNRRDSASQESMLELTVANQIMRNDPQRALEIARRNLKRANYSANLFNTVSELKRQNPELASQLASEIGSKILTEKLLTRTDVANLAVGLLRYGQTWRRGQPVSQSIYDDGSGGRTRLLPDSQYRELLQKTLNEALSYSPTAPNIYTPERDAAWTLLNGLSQFGTELDTVMTGAAAAVEKKLTVLKGEDPKVQAYQNALANSPVDAALETIEKAPAEQREQLYQQLAQREANNGDIARARQIVNQRVPNGYQRRNALLNFDRQEIYSAFSKGKIEEALRMIGAFRSARERADFLMNLATQIGPGQKRANAIVLLEQARNLLGASQLAEDSQQMNALIEIARAFSKYDTKRSFEILDPLIEQFNDLCAAAHTMQGFGQEYYEDDELNMQNGGSMVQIAQRMSQLLGTLAVTNFERARATSERIKLPEVRLKIYLDIAQQTIQGTAR